MVSDSSDVHSLIVVTSSALSAGVYLLKVKIGEQEASLRLLKK